MREFFRGWRRKVGVGTLLMACVVMGGWMRSVKTFDCFRLIQNRWHFVLIQSDRGTLTLFDSHPNSIEAVLWWYGDQGETVEPCDPLKPQDDLKIEWRWDWAGFIVGAFSALDNTQQLIRTDVFLVPYWFIVCTLTTLSAFLLLPKTRQSTPKKTSEAVPAKQD